MNLRRQLLVSVLLWVSLCGFLATTIPSGLPVIFLIVPFILLFAACYSSWRLLQHVGVRYFARGRPHKHLGISVCASVMLLLVLQSLGQLTLRDVITVAAIASIGYVYLGRVKARHVYADPGS